MSKKEQKVCIEKDCKNHAGKDSFYCGKHKPTGKPSKALCHTGNLLVAEPQGIKVYAGGKSRNGGWARMNPYPGLAIGPSEILTTFGGGLANLPALFKKSKSAAEVPEFVSLPWPDFDIPQVPPSFWRALVDDILANDIKTISTQCMGGHGRTGVQLAILIPLLTPKDEWDESWTDTAAIIRWVRETYCSHAVETSGQIDYIAEALGIDKGDTAGLVSSGGIYSYTAANYTQVAPSSFTPKQAHRAGDKLVGGEWIRECGVCRQSMPRSMFLDDDDECWDCYAENVNDVPKVESLDEEGEDDKNDDPITDEELGNSTVCSTMARANFECECGTLYEMQDERCIVCGEREVIMPLFSGGVY